MKREDIIEVLQACLLVLDGGTFKENSQFNPSYWDMGKKLIIYLTALEVTA